MWDRLPPPLAKTVRSHTLLREVPGTLSRFQSQGWGTNLFTKLYMAKSEVSRVIIPLDFKSGKEKEFNFHTVTSEARGIAVSVYRI